MSRTYIICTTARSGSNLLCNYLAHDGNFGQPEEYFNADSIRIFDDNGDFQFGDYLHLGAYIEWLKSRFTSENGVFGIKILYDDLVTLLGFHDFAKLFEESTKIFLLRRSVIDQAVSFYFAEQTGQWKSSDIAVKPIEDVVFDFDRLQAILDEMTWKSANLRKILNCFLPPPVDIYMEDFVHNPLESLGQIAQALGVRRPETALATIAEQSHARKRFFKQNIIDALRNQLMKRVESTRHGSIEIRS